MSNYKAFSLAVSGVVATMAIVCHLGVQALDKATAQQCRTHDGPRLHIRSIWIGVQTMAMQPTESVNTALGGVSPPPVITPSGDGYRTTGESCGTVQSNFF
jgi:hypothetical protein